MKKKKERKEKRREKICNTTSYKINVCHAVHVEKEKSVSSLIFFFNILSIAMGNPRTIKRSHKSVHIQNFAHVQNPTNY